MKQLLCPLCQKALTSKGLTSHLKRCNDTDSTIESLRIESLISVQPKLRECALRKLYCVDELSVLELAKQLGISYKDIRLCLREYGIKHRSLSDAARARGAKVQREQTNFERYGHKNPSQAKSIKAKKAATFKKHYGVDNIFKSEQFKARLNALMFERYGKLRLTSSEKISRARRARSQDEIDATTQKYIATCKERYGVDNYSQYFWQHATAEQRQAHGKKISAAWSRLSDDEKELRLAHLCSRQPSQGFTSRLELRVQSLLNAAGISYNAQKFVAGRSFDIHVRGTKILLEVNGDYWHANPQRYKANDIISYPFGHTKASDIWQRDELKRQAAHDAGFKVWYIWEKDIYQMDDEQLLGHLIEVIDANQVNYKGSIDIETV